jgi:hypothetical protein
VALAAALSFTHAFSSLSRTRPLLLPFLLTSLLPPQCQRSAVPPHAAAPSHRHGALSSPCHSSIPLAHGSALTSTIPCARSRPRFRRGKARAGVSLHSNTMAAELGPPWLELPSSPFPLFFFDFTLALTSRTPRAPRLSSPWPGPVYADEPCWRTTIQAVDLNLELLWCLCLAHRVRLVVREPLVVTSPSASSPVARSAGQRLPCPGVTGKWGQLTTGTR